MLLVIAIITYINKQNGLRNVRYNNRYNHNDHYHGHDARWWPSTSLASNPSTSHCNTRDSYRNDSCRYRLLHIWLITSRGLFLLTCFKGLKQMKKLTCRMFHGLTAYSGKNVNTYQVRKCYGNHIAVADRPIGAIGVCFEGVLTDLFSQDVWSYVDSKDNIRKPEQNYAQYILAYDDNGLHEDNAYQHCADTYRYNKEYGSYKGYQKDYCEGFMFAQSTRFVWIKSWANKDQKEYAKKLADKLNTICVVVKGTDRIWRSLSNKYGYND